MDIITTRIMDTIMVTRGIIRVTPCTDPAEEIITITTGQVKDKETTTERTLLLIGEGRKLKKREEL